MSAISGLSPAQPPADPPAEPPGLPAELPARLRAARERAGLTVAALARQMGRTAPEPVRETLPSVTFMARTIRAHEAGSQRVGARYRLLWSRALDIPEGELFGNPRQLIGARLRAEREAPPYWTRGQLAQLLLDAADVGQQLADVAALAEMIKHWETGKISPGPKYRPLYAAVTGQSEQYLFAPHAGQVRPGSVVDAVELHVRDDDDNMDRRTLLQLALGVGALSAAGEPVRQLLGLHVGSEPRDLPAWHLTAADHLHALRTRPATQVHDALNIDLLAVERQIAGSTGAGERRELYGVVAMLAVLQAHALSRLAEHGAALRWWRTARSAADTCGDPDLQLAVRSEEAGVGLYGQRDPQVVLALLGQAQALAVGPRAFWLHDLANTQAKALALLGRHEEAAAALRTCLDHAGAGEPTGLLAGLWKPDKPHFCASWVYAAAGDEARADAERDWVLAYHRGGAGFEPYPVNVRLHEAWCAVRCGGVDQGVTLAATVLDGLRASQRVTFITETAQAVLASVPLDQLNRPAVRDLQALTAGPAQLA